MKKIFTLFAAILVALSASAVVKEVYYQGKTLTGDIDAFTVAGKTNTRYTATYNAPTGVVVKTTAGHKMDSSGKFSFTTTTTTSNVIVVQSISANPTVTIKLDGKALSDGVENPSEGDVTVKVYTTTVGPGVHEITKGNSEGGVVYVSYEEIESGLQRLATPEISFNVTTGEVTISQSENAEIRYTTDGSLPSAESILYEGAFVVEDNTIVTAVAIGDNVSTENSNFATENVILQGFQVATPEIKAINGTFFASSATVNATVEYSYDNTVWAPLTRAITVADNTKVYARATRANCTDSEVAEANVNVLPAVESEQTILMGWGSFDDPVKNADETYTLNGAAGDPAEGYSISCLTPKKNYQNGSAFKMIMHADAERTGIKLSNGATNVLKVKEGYVATRITLYSTVNVDAKARTSYWREICNDGEALEVVNNIEMGSFKDYANPDVRVYNLNRAKEIRFTNTGEQLFFVIALDVVEDVPTLSAPWVQDGGEGVEYVDGQRIYINHELADVEIIYTLDGSDPDENYFTAEPAAAPRRAATADEDHNGKTYKQSERAIYYTAGQPMNIRFKAIKDGYKPSAVVDLGIGENGSTTGIENVAVDGANGPAEYFNLQGIRVENPSNGIFIRRQGNKVAKVIL